MFFFIAVFVFGLAYVLIPLAIGVSWKIGAVDVPHDFRRLHQKPIPRGGGLAIFFSFAVGFCLLFDLHSPFWLCVLLGGAAMLLLGLIDDVFCLGAWSKLLLQTGIATAVAVVAGFTEPFSLLAVVFWILLLTNAHNMIDGMDGLLAGCAVVEGSLLCLAYALLGSSDLSQCVGLLCACSIAFYLYNRFPASVFAGDCGSECIGFLFGLLSIPLFSIAETPLSTVSPLFLFAYPLTDLASAVLRRALRGKKLFSADRGHLHHRLYSAGLSQRATIGILASIAFCFASIGVLLCVERLWLFASIGCIGTVCVLLGMRQGILSFARKKDKKEKIRLLENK